MSNRTTRMTRLARIRARHPPSPDRCASGGSEPVGSGVDLNSRGPVHPGVNDRTPGATSREAAEA